MFKRLAMFGLFLALMFVQHVVEAQSTYEITIPAEPPYFRVRYEGSTAEGELVYPVSYTMWISPEVKKLRGVIVHQHGCGEGSCKSGQTGAFDLHWQALAKKHSCALISPVYEQPDKENCQLWCDPRNGSDKAFQKGLADLAKVSGHAELTQVPWAIWGHSGGGHWAAAMVLMHPDRVAAAWLRSGVASVKEVEGKPKPHNISDVALTVPMMCNLGTKEGVSDKASRFAGVWPGVQTFFETLRPKGALLGIAIDPFSSHDCGNQRYMAIQWFDAVLKDRLPDQLGAPLRAMPDAAWLASIDSEGNVTAPVAAKDYQGDVKQSVWLPNQAVAIAWQQYIKDTAIEDTTPPPAPKNIRVDGNVLTWEAEADLESGLAGFVIQRDGQEVAKLPEQPKNPFGRPLFQNLQYSDTPSQPLVQMRYVDANAEQGKKHEYRVIAVNTVGLKSN